MTYKFVITDRFYKDLDGVIHYISKVLGNSNAADNLLVDIDKTFRNILENPFSYSASVDEKLSSDGYRRAKTKSYLIFYRIDSARNTIYIIRMFLAKRDYSRLL